MGNKQSSSKPSAKAAGKAKGRESNRNPERPRGVATNLPEAAGGAPASDTKTSTPTFLSDTTKKLDVVVDDNITPLETSILNESNMDSDSEEEKDQEFEDALLERRRVLEDAKALKQLAKFFQHPEAPVESGTAARCFFDRPSAPERLSYEEAEEKALIMQDMAALKSRAVDFYHPEAPVKVEDATATARCFFDRPSAPERLSNEETEERARVLADAAALKEQAGFFMHPEVPVQTSDPYACGRNYFNRASAPMPDAEEEEARAGVLADAAALKEHAGFFMHPEKPVETTDPCACGRNYFQRYSAPEQEDAEAAMERALVLQDCAALKQLAVDYHHPELPVETSDPFACGRNYFSRPSAPRPQEDEEVDAEERARVLEDCKALRQKAADYLHPELPVKTTDPFACGRNYFNRPSAPVSEDLEESLECAKILEESRQLKQLAVDFHHPEIPVTTTDPFACGRNFFTRPSAAGLEENVDEEERAAILAECQALKTQAVFYQHPEIPVVTKDPFACGRNYFSRFSSPDQVTQEEAGERARILEEASILREYATMFQHPEIPVVTKDAKALGRNYFSRYNARGHAHMVHTFPAHEHDEHHEDHHEHVEHWGMEEDEDAMFAEMRQSLVVPTQAKVAAGGEDEESNLSRSPSSVMLHMGESIYD